MSHIKIDQLPDNTTDRLRLVAKVIRENPDQWNQGSWFNDPDIDTYEITYNPMLAVGRTDVCNTAACQAGWLVAFTPELPPTERTWVRAGAWAGGIAEALADVMFNENFGTYHDASDIANYLEALAEIPEGGRTLASAIASSRSSSSWPRRPSCSTTTTTDQRSG